MSKKPKITLLMTSCVFVSAPFVKLTNVDERIRLTLLSIDNWLKIHPDLKIVVCDGSGYDFTDVCRAKFLTADIECLSFLNNSERVAEYGKGYGEGEIIDYCLTHSVFIKESDFFVKCTAKLWVHNFNTLIKEWNSIFLCFLGLEIKLKEKSVSIAWLDTRFFIINKLFYDRYFRMAYARVRDKEHYYIEHVFKDIVIENKISVRNCFVKYYPKVRGFSGTTAQEYKEAVSTKTFIRHKLTNLLLWLFKL